jgi:hypothetical protein
MASEHEGDLVSELMRQVEAERELAVTLDDYAGAWVAVREHLVVAHAETLSALLEEIDPDSVEGVFQVTEQGTACFF